MFTGLVQAIGTIAAVEPLAGGVRIRVDAAGLAPRTLAVGDSIAINGACMTATRIEGTHFTADVSRESLDRTSGLDRVGPVNLETSLALGDVLGGHLVAGHVDGVGTVLRFEPRGESVELVIEVPAALAPLMAPKGSVCVHGVSLTVNQVRDRLPAGPGTPCEISINLIPHTLAATTLHRLQAGARVNLEADLLARYVARMRERETAENASRSTDGTPAL